MTRTSEPIEPVEARARLESALDHTPGLLTSGGVEEKGRYQPMDVGYVDPPLVLRGHGRTMTVEASTEDGARLLDALLPVLSGVLELEGASAARVTGTVRCTEQSFAEEDRTRRPSVFTVLRAVREALAGPDPWWGLYGAFGYDLVFQFHDVPQRMARPDDRPDLVLHVPSTIEVIDHVAGLARRLDYSWSLPGAVQPPARERLRVQDPPRPKVPAQPAQPPCDLAPGAYAALVRQAKDRFVSGDLFEVVPSRATTRAYPGSPAALFRDLRARNPVPYGIFANLGGGEFLVGASPEMFVRVTPDGDGGPSMVETCPISGTVPRGRDALQDAEQIRQLLGSAKDECELTMCTDVDRNDKSRVCATGTVEVLLRRHIEVYATVIHTVDHVRGELRDECDGIDAFVSHMWAVTVTGAPKRAAIEFIEAHEHAPRHWYGGAVGRLGFDGSVETALTLRTIELCDGTATVRAGATLLYDSDPDAEEAETVLKAASLLAALDGRTPKPLAKRAPLPRTGADILLVDHRDSFVNTLADYLRQAGAAVQTFAHDVAGARLPDLDPRLVVLSPGPGRPDDFGTRRLLSAALAGDRGVFGVCLGLQAIVEFFGGELLTLPEPAHGKASQITVVDGGGVLFDGLPARFAAGRYHSLCADPVMLPECLRVTAYSDDGIIMALEHRSLPIAAVQFHPESILTQHGDHGRRLVANAVRSLPTPAQCVDLRVLAEEASLEPA